MDNFRGVASITVDTILNKFGEKEGIRVKPFDSDPYKIRGVFSEQYYETDSNGTLLSTRTPWVFISLSELKQPLIEGQDHLIVRATEYRIVKVEKDGEGNAMIYLHTVIDDDPIGDENYRLEPYLEKESAPYLDDDFEDYLDDIEEYDSQDDSFESQIDFN